MIAFDTIGIACQSIRCRQSSRQKEVQTRNQPSVTHIVVFFVLCLANDKCNGFTLHAKHRIAIFRQANMPTRSITRLFNRRGLSDTQHEDPLFFARGMLEQTDETHFDDNTTFDSPSQSNDDGLFYAQQSVRRNTQSSGGMGSYVAQSQVSSMPSPNEESTQYHETENTDADSSWNVPQNQSTDGQNEETLTNTYISSVTSSQPISSVDARVLESILQEGKLNLSTEEQVKKLLEGPRVDVNAADVVDSGSGEYSSQFVSKISDNTFWNSVKAKAGEVIESVQIYIENRIERDAQTLAAVGLFAFDRIQRDISRALPAAGRQVKKLLLASNSTYAEKLVEATEKTVMALPSEKSATDWELDPYEELTTPADEIKQVTEAIRDILAGKELSASASAGSRSRVVRSLAPAGTARMAERQQRAYQARKRTVLQREREGIDKTFGRAIGAVSDATWELQHEMNSGVGREAGYRSEGVRKALTSGAVQLLEAGRESSRRLLNRSSQNKMLDGDVGARGSYATNANVGDFDLIQEEQLVDEIIKETNLEYAPDGLLSPGSFLEEKRRLISSLESCLSQPGETWLTREAVSQATASGIGLDGDVLRQIIASMVTLRDELKEELVAETKEERVYLKIDHVQNGLRRMKQTADMITDLAVTAAGRDAAILLKSELEGFVLSDSLDEIIEIELERLEQLLAEMVATREREMKIQTKHDYVDTFEYPVSVVDVVKEETFQTQQPTQSGRRMYTDVQVEPRTPPDLPASTQDDHADRKNQTPGNTVELLTNDEYFEYEQQFKTVQSSDLIDDDKESTSNPAVKFILRVIDAFFFVGEKFFLVGLPIILTTGSNASFRYSQAQNRGNGSDGWQSLKNTKRKRN